MNQIIRFLFLALFLTVSTQVAYSQQEDPKEAKKRAKEEAKRQKEEMKQYKKMKPEQIKAIKTGFDRLSSDLNNCVIGKDSMQRRMAELENQVRMQDSALKSMEQEVATAKTQVAEAQAMASHSKGGKKSSKSGDVSTASTSVDVNENGDEGSRIANYKGVVFAVQLGAYRNFSISNMGKKGVNGETVDGVNKYLLGIFADYRKASSFKTEIQSMGIKDAWVVAFKNGQRINIEEAKKAKGVSGQE